MTIDFYEVVYIFGEYISYARSVVITVVSFAN